jgi:hypothetical protein
MEEMTDSQQEPSQLVNDISSLLVKSGAQMHEIQVDPENNLMLRVWVKELTFLQMQAAIKSFVEISAEGGVNLDLAGYWRYMMDECIERTEPQMTKTQMLGLKASIAQQITALLPQPQDLMGPL